MIETWRIITCPVYFDGAGREARGNGSEERG